MKIDIDAAFFYNEAWLVSTGLLVPMKTISLILSSAVMLVMASCEWSLPSTPPPSVTNPSVLATFNRAKNGNGDALYQIAEMYRDGTHGFPVKRTLAEMIIIDAARANPPSGAALYELYEEDLSGGYTNSAINRLFKSAEQGYPPAIRKIESMKQELHERDRNREEFMRQHLRSKGIIQ